MQEKPQLCCSMGLGWHARRYDFFLASPLLGATRLEAEFDYGGTHVWVSSCVVQGLRCFFVEPANGFFAVSAVYGRADDALRFDFFNKARCARSAASLLCPGEAVMFVAHATRQACCRAPRDDGLGVLFCRLRWSSCW